MALIKSRVAPFCARIKAFNSQQHSAACAWIAAVLVAAASAEAAAWRYDYVSTCVMYGLDKEQANEYFTEQAKRRGWIVDDNIG